MRKDGRIPFISPEMKKKIKKQIYESRTLGGIVSTKAEADELVKKLRKKGYITWVERSNGLWIVEKSKIDFIYGKSII